MKMSPEGYEHMITQVEKLIDGKKFFLFICEDDNKAVHRMGNLDEPAALAVNYCMKQIVSGGLE